MKIFLQAHATHPDWRYALELVQAQLQAQQQERAPFAPTLGWVYLSDHYAAHAEALLDALKERWPGVVWVGAVGIGVAACGVEYFDEPALSLMLAELPRTQFRLFSGVLPLGDFAADTALVHADPGTPDLAELVRDMSERTRSGYLFGGLASSRKRTLHIADTVLQGGLSGVAFDAEVALISRVTQGCQPIGPLRRIDASQQNLVTRLDGQGALDCLLADLQCPGADPREALPRIRETLAGLLDPADVDSATPTRRGAFGPDTRVRHLIGLDPAQRGVAITDVARQGLRLAFCKRSTETARRDLMRICAEIREEVEGSAADLDLDKGGATTPARRMLGAVYISCTGRGGPHFGAPSAELAVLRHALGEVPLVGFFAAGEIARHHLYGYTGVLTVFTAPA